MGHVSRDRNLWSHGAGHPSFHGNQACYHGNRHRYHGKHGLNGKHGETKMAKSKMAESKMAESKMADPKILKIFS